MPRGDVLINNKKYKNLKIEELPANSVIGSSSLRRISTMKHKHPHLIFKNIRGNLNTRIKKLEEGEKI
jgi:hydroxymethylbilane synthase